MTSRSVDDESRDLRRLSSTCCTLKEGLGETSEVGLTGLERNRGYRLMVVDGGGAEALSQ